MSEELQKRTDMEMSIEQVRGQVNLIQKVMREVMSEGEHYGKIPGCGPKPTLLKPGAEKLNLTFRLAPTYQITQRDLPGGHREYQLICTLTHIPSQSVFGQGVGCCSTMEGKYRFRWVNQERVEHDNPADYFNTALKIAKKRAHVDAVLTCTAASDIFTQDLEDMDGNGVAPVKAAPKAPAPPKQAPKGDVEKGRRMIRQVLQDNYKGVVAEGDEVFTGWLAKQKFPTSLNALDYSQALLVYEELNKKKNSLDAYLKEVVHQEKVMELPPEERGEADIQM